MEDLVHLVLLEHAGQKETREFRACLAFQEDGDHLELVERRVPAVTLAQAEILANLDDKVILELAGPLERKAAMDHRVRQEVTVILGRQE